MKRAIPLLLFLAGCGTAPIADFLDLVRPAKDTVGKGQERGGVCNPAPGAPPVGAVPAGRIAGQPGFDPPPPAPPPVGP